MQPPAEKISIPDRGVDLFLDQSFGTSGTPWAKNWSCETTFEVVPTNSESIRWHFRIREELRSLFALLVGEPIYTKRLQLVDDAIPIDMIHGQRGGLRDGSTSPPEMRDVLLTLDNVRAAGMAESFRRLFYVASRFKPTLDLYLGTVYPPQTFVEFEFIALTQALESFHRRRYPGT